MKAVMGEFQDEVDFLHHGKTKIPATTELQAIQYFCRINKFILQPMRSTTY